MRQLTKSSFREIKHSFGQFLAILAIIALGVGFFAGLKVCKPAMLETAQTYLNETQLYDYKMVSTLGFTQENLDIFERTGETKAFEGAITHDALCTRENKTDVVFRFHSLTKDLNMVSLVAGRMPENANECLADESLYSESNLSETIHLDENNTAETLDYFGTTDYTIVGIVASPLYLNMDRGNSELGDGKVKGAIFLPEDGFNTDIYTEVYVTLRYPFPIYSEDYDAYIAANKAIMTKNMDAMSANRYTTIQATAQSDIDAAQATYQKNLDAFTASKTSTQADLANGEAQISSGLSQIQTERANLVNQRALLNQQLNEATTGLETLSGQISALAQQQAVMDPTEYASTLGALTAQQTALNQSLVDLQNGLDEVDVGFYTLDQNEATLNAQLETLKSQEASANAEFATAENDLAAAQAKINSAQADLSTLEAPQSTLLTRDSNIGYMSFKNDVSIVDGIANVFPVFFFLIAALVCMTTMSRMVEEHRSQTGILKALGVSDASLYHKFIRYAGLATLLGSIIGFIFGSLWMPRLIWNSYDISYSFQTPIQFFFSWPLALISLAVALLCGIGITVFVCRKEFKESPAMLMRPKTPKSGQSIFLERITPLWKRLPFLSKISLRNIFRYKQRLAMMIIGMSGCTALLLTGFGVNDSIQNVLNFQFDEVTVYDYALYFDDSMTPETLVTLQDTLNEKIDNLIALNQSTLSLDKINGQATDSTRTLVGNILYDETLEDYQTFVDLHTGDTPIDFPKEGEIVVCKKVASDNNLAIGDSLTLEDEDNHPFTLTVSAICDNYLYNNVYLNRDSLDFEPTMNAAFVTIPEGQDVYDSAKTALNQSGVIATTVNAGLRTQIDNTMESMNYIVFVLILCAGALSFIVSYNLTNINITERIREIATLKVLGFYPLETAAYVFRENFLLTLLSLIPGLLLGLLLHRFVIGAVQVDLLWFEPRIAPISFLYAIGLTLIFTLVVNLVMFYRIQKIDMTSSLKTME